MVSSNEGRLAQAWRSYKQDVIGPRAPQAQYDECRKAFYAGASALFEAMTDLDPGLEPTQEDLDRVTALKAELDAFPSIADTTQA